MSTIINKVNHIFSLMKMLFEGREIYVQDKILQEELSINERTLRRYLDDIVQNFSDVILVEKKRKDIISRKTNIYRVVDKNKDISTVLRFFLENTTDLSWVIKLLNEQDPSLINNSKGDIKHAVEDILDKQKDIFIFRAPPFELMQSEKQKKLFATIKRAVQNHEYATIIYLYNKKEILHNVKCLKIIYMHNNWYLAIEDEQNRFKFLRFSFIETIKYSDKNTFQMVKIKKYNRFFKEFQNAFSLPNTTEKTAHLLASKKVAKYFKKDMKSFFFSQKIIKEYNDGSVEFSVEYTQILEVLPFIKNWLPDIRILSPKSLQDEFKQDLHKALNVCVN